MPGMIHPEGSPSSASSFPLPPTPSLSSPLQSFSSLALAPQHLQMMTMAGPASFCSQDLRSEERGLLIIQLLLRCAAAVAAGEIDHSSRLLEQLHLLASLTGDPMQRVAAHFMEALAARATRAWPGLYKALHCTHLPPPSELLACRQIFFGLCPYLKFAFTLVNHSILHAMEGEKVVHIIDLGACEAVQWVAMLQMLSSRPGGPPHLRITIVNPRKDLLDQLGQKLCEEAEVLDIPFQFNPVVLRLEDVTLETLRVKTGEAVAISSVLQLHRLLTDDAAEGKLNLRETANGGLQWGLLRQADITQLFEKEGKELNPALRLGACGADQRNSMTRPYPSVTAADRMLGIARAVLPKVMVIMEGEANLNGADFMERFVEALHYYGALFDSLESSLPPKLAGERLMMERHMFGRAIHNIVACEGVERVERQERLPSWIKRAQAAGLSQVRFPNAAQTNARRILSSYSVCDGYKVVEDRGCLTVCWQETPLFSASAWYA